MIDSPEIVSYKDFLWIVKAKFPERLGNSSYNFDELKEKYKGNMVLKRGNQYYVCQIIEDAEVEMIDPEAKELCEPPQEK